MTVLAELLNQRKAAFERLHLAQGQIAKTAIVEEPDLTVEVKAEVAALVEDMTASAAFIQEATIAINVANNGAFLVFEGDRMSLMGAIAMRDRLSLLVKQREATISEIEDALGLGDARSRRFYSMRERRNKDDIKEVAALDIKAFREATREYATRVRLLDIEIQKVNWSFAV